MMACCLVGAKPLYKPMLQKFLFEPDKQTSVKSKAKFVHYTIRMFPPAIDIIPTLLAVVFLHGKYTN